MSAIGDFDHCMILVGDLDRAALALQQLGFRTTPRGRHSTQMGTGNTTVPFENDTYLEPLGVLEPTSANAGQRARLAERSGPYGLAFKTVDAAAAAAELAAVRLGPNEVQSFSRPVELPTGTAEAAFRVARSHGEATPGGWLFCCQHLTPEVVWREDHLRHPNGALGLVELIGFAPDLDAVAAGWSLFGERIERRADAVTVATATASLTFLTGPAFAARFPGSRLPSPEGPTVLALSIATSSLGSLRELLPPDRLRNPEGNRLWLEEAELGAIFEFVPA